MRSQMKLAVIGFVLKMSLLSVWAADLQTFREAYQKSADAILQKYQPNSPDCSSSTSSRWRR